MYIGKYSEFNDVIKYTQKTPLSVNTGKHITNYITCASVVKTKRATSLPLVL